MKTHSVEAQLKFTPFQHGAAQRNCLDLIDEASDLTPSIEVQEALIVVAEKLFCFAASARDVWRLVLSDVALNEQLLMHHSVEDQMADDMLLEAIAKVYDAAGVDADTGGFVYEEARNVLLRVVSGFLGSAASGEPAVH